MFKYFLILLVVLGFVVANNKTFCRTELIFQEKKSPSKQTIDKQQSKINELQTQVKILEGAREGYTDNITTIGVVATLLVGFIFFFVGFIIPSRINKKFNKRMDKIVKEQGKTFDDKIAELEYKNADLGQDLYFTLYYLNIFNDNIMQLLSFLTSWKYHISRQLLKNKNPKLPGIELSDYFHDYKKIIDKFDKSIIDNIEKEEIKEGIYRMLDESHQEIENIFEDDRERKRFIELRKQFIDKIKIED